MTFRGQHLLMIGAVLLISAACASKPPQKIGGVRNYNATFLCDGTKLLTVSFTPFAARLESDGVSADLAQQPTADGFLYTGGGQSLHARGTGASWIDTKGAAHQCQERPGLVIPARP